MKSAKKISSFIKLEHTLFSLPLLFAGALLHPQAQKGLQNLPWERLGLILLAGIGARTAALALNRLIDRRIDAKNPRTKMRELPSGALTQAQGWAVAASGTVIYLAAAWWLGPFCFKLSPIPLIVFVAYPLMKRFTYLAHFGVGLGLALAPMGAYVGLGDAWPETTAPWWLAGFTLCWVAGFDILYATMDEAFDRKEGLHSIPSRFGSAAAQDASLTLHGLAAFCLVGLRWDAFGHQGHWIWLAMLPALALLAAEQRWGYSLEKDSPFFKINAWIGVAVLGYVLLGVL